MSKLDVKVRGTLKQGENHHVNASVDCLYLPRSEGGRGLVSVELAWESECVVTAIYLLQSQDPQVKGAVRLRRQLMHMGLESRFDKPRYVSNKYDLEVDFETPWDRSGPSAAQVLAQLKSAQLERIRLRLREKTIHGVYAVQITDQKATHRWLTDGRLQAQTEAIIIAAQDGVTHTNAYRARVLKQTGDDTCRVCKKAQETVGHILSACEAYKWTLYLNRHNRILLQLVKAVAMKLGIVIPKELRAPRGTIGWGKMGSENSYVILVDQCRPTDRRLKERKPDLIVKMVR